MDYIEREKAKELFDDTLVSTFARGILDECPSAFIVSIVRCKNCRRWTPDGGVGIGLDGTKWQYGECSLTKMSVKENDFCSYGERVR